VIDGYDLHGHAIVSADDRIADRSGLTPEALRNEADWSRFQAALDQACVTILGRRGHEVNPNIKGRNRLVLSSSAEGIERRDDGWWWNPAKVPLGDALAEAAPSGGIVVVPGGRRVFDLFLSVGFDAFHLARAPGVRFPEGVPLFSEIGPGSSAAQILTAHGLVADPTEMLDPAAAVEMTVWRRP
jgi:hypothetical protein